MNWRRRLAWGAGALAVLLIAAVALLLNELRTLHVLYVQGCVEERAWPGSSNLCRLALYRFHPTPGEVEEMNRTAGATWALSMPDEDEARRLLQHYIAAGLDVNATDQRDPDVRWTALHVAASGSDLRGVRLLLAAGARADARDAKGRAALDLVREQAQKLPQDPRDAEIAAVLQAAMGMPGTK